MARIPPKLISRLSDQLGISDKGVYRRIGQVASRTHLPTRLAAIKLAMENAIGVSRYASDEDLREIRGSPASAPVVVIPPVITDVVPVRRGRVKKTKKTPGTSVFVVHGRNEQIRSSMFDLLRAMGLHPIEWSQARKLTRKPNPHIGEILEAAFKEAAAVLVLFTPDELVRQKPEFIRASDPEHERRESEQSRPNVLFESGMAMGRDPDRTLLVEIGTVRPFSDIAGRHLLRFDGSAASRNELADRLESARCQVRRDGTDWLGIGDFFLSATPRRGGRRR